jgi:hypothetical protein
MATTAYMIKKFGVMSVAKFSAVIGLIWGFIVGLMGQWVLAELRPCLEGVR